MIFDKLKRRINNTSTERKPRMPHIHCIKGKAVVIYCEPLITKTP